MNCVRTHVKPVAARAVTVAITQSAPKLRPSIVARDGAILSMGEPLCGGHLNTLSPLPKARAVPVAMAEGFGENTDLLLDYAKRRYEKQLDEAEARKREDEAHYAARQREENDRTFTVKRKDDPNAKEYGDVVEWVVSDAENGRPVTGASVYREGGQLRFRTSNYSGHVGRGQGTLRWLQTMQAIMSEAATVMELDIERQG